MRNEEFIATLNECASFCNYCADACLNEDNISMMVSCIRNDRICAEICSSLSKILSMDVPNEEVTALVEYCKSVCERCAAECASHEAQHCKNCAVACNKCVDACSKFLYTN
ncbi:MAG: four-helix bundle copper-binding protein [Leeuwenhoekiella sp.]|nr:MULTISPECIES: four-helix bundle copper-binding protein [unclassified Leeuwenhoekiella]MBA80723.1 four-helix bundle copper-binding protein [Leeuwenhoekiella sp.]